MAQLESHYLLLLFLLAPLAAARGIATTNGVSEVLLESSKRVGDKRWVLDHLLHVRRLIGHELLPLLARDHVRRLRHAVASSLLSVLPLILHKQLVE